MGYRDAVNIVERALGRWCEPAARRYWVKLSDKTPPRGQLTRS